MPFAEAFDAIYRKGIKVAADDVGAYAERVDEQVYEGSIVERIYNQISRADLLVADVTSRNPNVFYEIGYAHALNKLVIPLAQNMEDVPFDMKHRLHVLYDGTPQDVRQKLTPFLKWGITQNRSQTLLEYPTILIGDISVPIAGTDSPPTIPLKPSPIPGHAYFSVDVLAVNESNSRFPTIEQVFLLVPASLPWSQPTTYGITEPAVIPWRSRNFQGQRYQEFKIRSDPLSLAPEASARIQFGFTSYASSQDDARRKFGGGPIVLGLVCELGMLKYPFHVQLG